MTPILLKIFISGCAAAILLLACAAFAIYLPVTRDDGVDDV